MSEIQLTGNLTLNETDYSDSISSIVIKRTRNLVTIPANLGNIRETEKATGLKEAVELTFHSGLDAASVWAELYDAIDTESAELDFAGTLNSGTISDDNPEFSGTLIVAGIDTGADVATLRQQSQTYPVTVDGITKNVTPA